MSKHIIHFKDVGRDKKTWTAQFNKTVTELDIAREVRKSGALMSSEIDAEFDENATTGTIIVGGWRAVGKFAIEKVA